MGEPKPVLIDGTLLEEAEALGLEIRGLVERELRRRIEKRRTANAWAEENKQFVESYNRYIDQRGPAGDEYRRYG
jgi:post-segregation antitoxin (ccd killing protein)